jgi:protein-tyrosine phosphatase
MYWVIPGVLAGRPGPDCAPWNVDQLVDAGVGAVVSLDGPVRVQDLLKAGIRHLPAYQPMFLLHGEEDHKRFLKVMVPILAFIDEQRAGGIATLVHCHYGCDRTGTVLSCYLVARENFTATQAVARVQKINPDAMWAVGYMEAVQTFEAIYRDHPSLFEAHRGE